LSWLASAQATGYLVYYAPVSGATSSGVVQAAAPLGLGTGSYRASEGRSPLDIGNTGSATLSGLRPGATYEVFVRAYGADGRTGPPSPAVRFVAPPALDRSYLPLIRR